MKLFVSMLVLVAVAGFIDCKPSGQELSNLRSRLQARVNELKTRKAGGDKDVSKGADDDEDNWPWGLMEFSSLAGKCATYHSWLYLFGLEETGSVLDTACPHVYEIGEKMVDLEVEELKDEERKLRKMFALLQCTILQAEREEVAFVSGILEVPEEDQVFEREVQPLIEMCEVVFENYQAILASLEEGEDDVSKALDQNKRTNVNALLRELIHAAARK